MSRFLYRELKGYRGLIAVAVVVTVAQVVAEVFAALPVKFLLDKLVNHRDPELFVFGRAASMFNGFGTTAGLRPGEQDTQLGIVVFCGVTIIVLAALAALFNRAQMRIAVYVAQSFSAKLRTRLFAHLQRLPLDWHVRQHSGDLVQRVTGNITDIEKLITDGLVDLLAGVLTIIGIVFVMAVINPRFALVAAFVIPVLFIVVLRYTLAIKSATRRGANAAGRVAQVAAEDFNAIVEVKSFVLEQHESDRFAGRVDAMREHMQRAGMLQAQFTPVVLFVVGVATAVIVGLGGYVAAGNTFRMWFLTIPAGSITVGTLTVFLTYLKQLYQPMRNLSKLANLTALANAGIERICEIFVEQPEDLDSPHDYDGPDTLVGHIRFQRVRFEYVEGHPVLKNIDLDMPPGRRVALVGLSGGGKTTLAKLIPRLHEVCGGRITIDGRDVREYPLSVLRRNISFVPQDSVLFDGTIRDNIAIGRAGATHVDVEDAAWRAHVHDQIMAFPDGYEHVVQEGGKNLSSGQRQRLAIARAMLRDAPILILDEPTANLDVEAESEVMHAIDTLIEGRTVLLISHRLSTLGRIDEIAVLHEGRIAERGPYATLCAAGGRFALMLAEQRRYYPPAFVDDYMGAELDYQATEVG